MEAIRQRYIPEQCIQQRTLGNLYLGKDLYFNRDVMFLVLDPADEAVTNAYVQSIRMVSHFSDERFMHVLDIDVNPDRIMAVLKPGAGRLIIDEIEKHTFTEMDIFKLVRDLGYGIHEARKEGISGYSVRADNLCLNSEDGLSVINYWEKADPLWCDIPGLCRLFYQLATRSKDAPENPELLCEGLQTALQAITSEQSQDILLRIRKALSGEAALPYLLSGFDRIVARHEGKQELKSFAPAATPRNPAVPRPPSPRPLQKAEKAPMTRNRKWLIGCSVLIVLLAAEMGIIRMIKKPEPIPEPVSIVKQEAPPQQGPQLKEPLAKPSVAQTAADNISTPALTGFSQEEAEKQALANGLRYQFFLEPHDTTKGTVFKQDPQPDAKVPKGTQVTFWVSKGK